MISTTTTTASPARWPVSARSTHRPRRAAGGRRPVWGSGSVRTVTPRSATYPPSLAVQNAVLELGLECLRLVLPLGVVGGNILRVDDERAGVDRNAGVG